MGPLEVKYVITSPLSLLIAEASTAWNFVPACALSVEIGSMIRTVIGAPAGNTPSAATVATDGAVRTSPVVVVVPSCSS